MINRSGKTLLVFLAVVVLGTGILAAARRQTRSDSRLGRADLVIVEKGERKLTLYRAGRPIKSYAIALGRNPTGHKEQEGDGRTPEGQYRIDFHKRDSAFHRALHISYPNAADIRKARRRGVSPGGDIMIHGLPNGWSAIGAGHRLRDWTDGCIAVTNEEIEEIWSAVPDQTKIEIRP